MESLVSTLPKVTKIEVIFKNVHKHGYLMLKTMFPTGKILCPSLFITHHYYNLSKNPNPSFPLSL
jgi:hypothetical protein